MGQIRWVWKLALMIHQSTGCDGRYKRLIHTRS
jgi:hypothetical protein